ncbi:MAG TPA: DNA-binding protein [Prolixibacteraceae bacterium]|nr:DNA-binding protein [Prolixibacteraceae bacterium]
MDQGEIVIYKAIDNADFQIEVRVENETVWLSQAQMSELFQTTRNNITLHIGNIFKEKELDENSVCKDSLLTASDGKKYKTKFYNLDVIISVGYRVKSKRGTQFRIWANKVLKDYLLKGYAANQRFERIENDVLYLKKKIDEFDFQIKTNLPPHEGVFYDGQIFDAHLFVSNLIKTANHSVILIDNYIDEDVLSLLSKRKTNIKATIYSANISRQLELDLKRFNAQYPKIEIKKFSKSHDRFLIIDQKSIYHIGASLKDLGKKWFAFSKIGLDIREMIEKLEREGSNTPC